MSGSTARVKMSDFKLTTPVAFIIFNRPDTSERVFSEIRKARPEKLYLISDAARKGRPEEEEKVRKCRETVEGMIDWDCEVKKDYAKENLGCKIRVSSGISWVLENEEETIVIEDDVVPSGQFFPFMQQMLNEYRDDPEIMMVSGTNLIKDYTIPGDYTFSYFSSIWGWGTWRRAWSRFYDVNMKDWEEEKNRKALRSVYNDPLSWWLFKREADRVFYGGKDTWDLQWDYCRMKQGALGIVPKHNMVNNIGFDREDATHTTDRSFEDFSYGEMHIPCDLITPIKEDILYDRAYLKKYMGIRKVINAVRKRLSI